MEGWWLEKKCTLSVTKRENISIQKNGIINNNNEPQKVFFFIIMSSIQVIQATKPISSEDEK